VLGERATSLRRHPSVAAGPGLHRDVATEVTLVHLRVPVGDPRVERHPLLDDLLAGCAAAEVEDELRRVARL
jgi:hypothetical protein